MEIGITQGNAKWYKFGKALNHSGSSKKIQYRQSSDLKHHNNDLLKNAKTLRLTF